VKAEDLVRMANQIAAFFAAYPEEEAVASTAGHLKSFWDPRMRAELLAHVAAGGDGLSDLALKAARKLAAES
jgi:formate dehydrogenase subunit delta